MATRVIKPGKGKEGQENKGNTNGSGFRADADGDAIIDDGADLELAAPTVGASGSVATPVAALASVPAVSPSTASSAALDHQTQFLAGLFRAEIGSLGDRVQMQFQAFDARVAGIEHVQQQHLAAMEELNARVVRLEE